MKSVVYQKLRTEEAAIAIDVHMTINGGARPKHHTTQYYRDRDGNPVSLKALTIQEKRAIANGYGTGPDSAHA